MARRAAALGHFLLLRIQSPIPDEIIIVIIYLLVSPWHQADCPKYLESGDLGLDVVSVEGLSDGVDAGGMGQHVCSPILQIYIDNFIYLI